MDPAITMLRCSIRCSLMHVCVSSWLNGNDVSETVDVLTLFWSHDFFSRFIILIFFFFGKKRNSRFFLHLRLFFFVFSVDFTTLPPGCAMNIQRALLRLASLLLAQDHSCFELALHYVSKKGVKVIFLSKGKKKEKKIRLVNHFIRKSFLSKHWRRLKLPEIALSVLSTIPFHLFPKACRRLFYLWRPLNSTLYFQYPTKNI